MKKRILALAMTLAMVLTLLPAAALAAEEEAPQDGAEVTATVLEDAAAPEEAPEEDAEAPAEDVESDEATPAAEYEEASLSEAGDTAELPGGEFDSKNSVAYIWYKSNGTDTARYFDSLDAAVAAAAKSNYTFSENWARRVGLCRSVFVTGNKTFADIQIDTRAYCLQANNGATLTLNHVKLTHIPDGNQANRTDYFRALACAPGGTLMINGGEFSSAEPELLVIWGNATITGEAEFTTTAKATTDNGWDGKPLVTVNGKDGDTSCKPVLTMESGSIDVSNTYEEGVTGGALHGITAFSGGTITLGKEGVIGGPTIKGSYVAIGGNNTLDPVTLTIYGGTYTTSVLSGGSAAAKYDSPIFASPRGTYRIYDGAFTAFTGGHAISIPYQKTAVDMTVSKGDFTGGIYLGTEDGVPSGEAKLSITGGTFTVDPSKVAKGDTTVNCVAPTHKAAKAENEEKWTVSEATGLVGETGTNAQGATTVDITGTANGTVDTGADEGLKGTSGAAIKVNASVASGSTATNNAEVTIAAETAASMNDGETTKITSIEVKADEVTVTLPEKAVEQIAAAGAGNEEAAGKAVTITVKKDEKPTGGADSDKISAQYTVEVKAGEEDVLPAGGQNGEIKITVPKPNGENVHAYWVSDDGKTVLSELPFKTSGDNMVITITHLSTIQVRTAAAALEEASYTDSNGELKAGTLAAAVTGAKDGTTITLNKDVELKSRLDIDLTSKSLTIDGNGKTISAASDISFASGSNALIKIEGGDAQKNITFQNVKLNGNSKGRVIFKTTKGEPKVGASTLTIGEGAVITGGLGKDGTGTDSYIGGVYVNSGKLVMNGGEITGNKSAGNYQNDGYLQYSGDVWIGNDAQAEIKGGKIGNMFINASTLGGDQGGKVTVTAGTIETAFVEAEDAHTGNVVSAKANTVKNLLIALDYIADEDDSSDRAIAQITPSGDLTTVKGLEIPTGQTATITGQVGTDGKKEFTLSQGITVGANATMVIPEDTTVTVKKDAEIPTITNNGTIQVGGKLIAGAGTSDEDYLKTTGTGTITAGPNGVADVDPGANTEVTFTLQSDGATVQTLKVIVAKDAKVKFSDIKSQINTLEKNGYELQGWLYNNRLVKDNTEFTGDAITLTASWKRTSTNPPIIFPGNGGNSGSTSGGSGGGHSSNVAKPGARPGSGSGNTGTGTETPATGFTDVPGSAYYAGAVQWAVNQGITYGTTSTTFSPNNPCTRGQIVTFLWRAAGSPAASGTNPFTDVPQDAYYYDAVLWAVANGITTGTSATTFSPNNACTRGQTVTFLYRYEKSPAVTAASSFTDVAAGAYYADAVAWAVANGITNGTSATTFGPDSTCTRGNIVTFLYRDMA